MRSGAGEAAWQDNGQASRPRVRPPLPRRLPSPDLSRRWGRSILCCWVRRRFPKSLRALLGVPADTWLSRPSAIFDCLRNRFAILAFVGHNTILLALSRTDDPTGEWRVFRFKEEPEFPAGATPLP